MMRYLLAAAGVLGCFATSGLADPAEDVLASLQTLGIEVTADDRQLITTQVAQAVAETKHPEWFVRSTALLVDMAELSQRAEYASARVRLGEMHFQTLYLLLPDENRARDLVNATNPMSHEAAPGIGMTARDVGWAMRLEAMREDLPERVDAMDISAEEGEELLAYVNKAFEEGSPSARIFLTTVDAWAFGTVMAWDQLTPDQRSVAVAVVTEPAIPAPEILQAVIGTEDILGWLGGTDIGLTTVEKAAYPELNSYLVAGHLAGDVIGGALAQRDNDMAAISEMIGQASTTMLMMELNYDLLLGNDLLGMP